MSSFAPRYLLPAGACMKEDTTLQATTEILWKLTAPYEQLPGLLSDVLHTSPVTVGTAGASGTEVSGKLNSFALGPLLYLRFFYRLHMSHWYFVPFSYALYLLYCTTR